MTKTYEELLDAGYSPADASMLTRTMHFLGTQTPQRSRSGTGPGSPRESEEEAHEYYDKHRAPLEERAHTVVGWIQKWRTWPKNGDRLAAYDAALAALTANPDINKFDLARVAINAARRVR